MGIFKKTIKYSKPSKDLDSKIKKLDEELKNTGVIDEQNVSEIFIVQEDFDEKEIKVYDELEVDIEKTESLYNWRESFVVEEDHSQDIVEEIEYKTVRKVESYISESNKELIEIRNQVFQEISESTLLNLPEIKSKIEKVLEIYDQIQEGLLNEPPETKNEDPLTPLNQNFITADDLNKHYSLFINRIQEQLATVGGGGETRLKYLDDIVGIATNAGSYNGKFLKYDHSLGKFIFDDPAGGGGSGSGDYANVAGIATYASIAGVSTYTQTAGISTYASTAGIATYASTAGVSTYAQTAGISTYASTAGIATYAISSGISTYSTSAGVSTYAQTAGISTYSSTAGIATYSSTAGVSTYAQTAGIATSAGTATTATYLSDAANIITGTINKDRITTTNALTVLGDLYVSNNISFGGTSTQLNAQQLQIVDADIVLGIGTSFSPTDNTANHGGIAIASTEGSPLVSLNIVPGETNPTTYKKIMWFKGDTIGAGITDAWLFNYAVGIGSTNVPNGVRLAVGNIRMTDNTVTATTFNGNATTAGYATTAGISTTAATLNIVDTNGLTNTFYPTFVEFRSDGQYVRADVDLKYRSDTNTLTASQFVGNLTGTATYSNISGISTYANTSGIATYSSTAGVSTIAGYATTAGIATVAQGLTGTPNITVSSVNSSGVVTASSFSGSGSNLTGIVTSITAGSGISINQSTGNVTITATGGGGGGSQTLDQTLALGNSSTLGMTVGVTTVTNLNVTGIATIGTGIVTTLRGTNINYIGVSTFTSTFVTNLNVSGIATIGTGIVTTLRGTTLNYTGISTFSNGPVFIGSGTTTGTASQPLQVTGGVYVSGSVGVGTTNPRETLDVIGTIGVQASGATNRFEIQHNTSLNSLDFIFL